MIVITAFINKNIQHQVLSPISLSKNNVILILINSNFFAEFLPIMFLNKGCYRFGLLDFGCDLDP